MPEGLAPSLEEAFAAAEAELGTAEPDEDTWDLPPEVPQAEAGGEQAPEAGEVEQPEAGNEADNLLDLLEEAAGPQTVNPSTPEFWGTEVEVEVGGRTERMTLDDLRKGAMRQADYTRKTQELARERALVSEAVDLHKALKEDPQGFARYLASKAGLIDEDQAAAVKGVPIYTDADIEAKVAERLEQALAEHPDVQAAKVQQAISTVDQVFAAIEDKWQTPLTLPNRKLILEEAQRRGATDIELVFESLLLRANQIAAQRQSAKKTAPSRPGGTPTADVAAPPKIVTVEDAMNAALQELSGTVA